MPKVQDVVLVARRQALEFLPNEESGEYHPAVGLPPAKALLRRREGNQAGR